MAGLAGRILDGLDRFQQRRRALAFSYATLRKFGEDHASNLASQVAYYGFFSIFPLLLVLVTVLGIVLRGNVSLQHRVLNSALVNFPLVGTDLKRNVHALSASTTLPLVIGIVLAVWAGVGVVKALEYSLNDVWNVPYRDRPNFLWSNLRALGLLVALGVLLVAAALAGGVGVGAGVWWLAVAGDIISLGLNVLVFLLAFRILTVAKVTWPDVLPGAVVAGVVWTVLQALGGYYVAHVVRGASATYGTFAIVIGLLTWIYVGAQLTLFAAEVNVVRSSRLWPRSLGYRSPTAADQRALKQLARIQERRRGERVHAVLPEEEREAEQEEREAADGRRRDERRAG